MHAWVKKTAQNERYVDTSTVEADLGLGSVDSMRLMRSIVSSALEQDAVVRALRTVHVDGDLGDVRTALWSHAPYKDDYIVLLRKDGKNARPFMVTARGMASIKTTCRALLVSTHDVVIAHGARRIHQGPPASQDVKMGASQVEVLLRAVEKSGCTRRFQTSVVAKMKTPPATQKSRHKKNKGGNPNCVTPSTHPATVAHHEAANPSFYGDIDYAAILAQRKKTAEKNKTAEKSKTAEMNKTAEMSKTAEKNKTAKTSLEAASSSSAPSDIKPPAAIPSPAASPLTTLQQEFKAIRDAKVSATTTRPDIFFQKVLARIEKQVELPVVPPLFTSPKQYQDVFGPLVVAEALGGLDLAPDMRSAVRVTCEGSCIVSTPSGTHGTTTLTEVTLAVSHRGTKPHDVVYFADGHRQGYGVIRSCNDKAMKMLVLPRWMDGVGTSIKLKAIGSVTTSLREYMAVASIGDIPPHLQAGLLSAPLRSTTAIAASSIASKDGPVEANLAHQHGEMSAHDVDPTCIPAPLRARLAAETDPSQCKAVNLVASETPGIKLLQGPPGTGKSRTIRMATSAVLAAADESARVLLCAPSNCAVDGLVASLLKDGILGRDGHAVVVTPPQCVSSGSGRVCTVLRLGRVQEGAPAIVQQACIDNVVAAEVASLSASKELQRVGRYEEAINVKFQAYRANRKPSAVSASDVQGWHRQREVLLQQKNYLKAQLSAAKSRITAALLAKADIIVCTLSQCGSEQLRSIPHGFDAVIVDEAGQATEPSTALALTLRTNRAILVGDHRQLMATVMVEAAKDGLQQSMFERLFKLGVPCVVFETQYRMHPFLREFPSKAFYNGILSDGPVIATRLHTLGMQVYKHPCYQPFVFFNTAFHQDRDGQLKKHVTRNSADAAFVIDMVTHMKDTVDLVSHKTWMIVLLTPYRDQLVLLSDMVTKRKWTDIEVHTIDGYQGREADIVIFSAVRSHGIGFLNSPQRLNVALTRGKFGTYVVGNASNLSQNELWASLVSHARSTHVLLDVGYKSFHHVWKEAEANTALKAHHQAVPPRQGSRLVLCACSELQAHAKLLVELKSTMAPNDPKRKRMPSPDGTSRVA
ncbi:hypothetical protein SPRG_05631 [Saprolegnia parasitica CBS 223.65]|uniref:Helicase ATP-binding domain-containing protein n=1 Tax=Saprolegnia parasitica (strain CBS 223.65) TaxID=695850 RepID=A0A067CG43_SAPPC|nr:hypothetical protein SPRG_05631 [Saprolegnia parasitica CBS 223.65]KDO29679.1 hypothetical protein SPRG_05631 [Saprolegnia parasitica CBS 223.65]|eukprot:XP_012199737.1 hypothetical protein SPRG_05631 [Saprolegnia parasitica CBS 223.65]